MLARAKVNLYLHVLGRRADGYHELDSLVVFAEYGDLLDAHPAADLSLKIGGRFARKLPATKGNLVLAAAAGLRALCDCAAGARLRLVKNLPVAAGVGGGSADAAAALRLLAAFWCLDPPAEALARLALSLGADVPVCLLGRPTRVGGIGEHLAPAPALPPAWLLLANPLRPTPTPQVFAARRGAFSAPSAAPSRFASFADLVAFLKETRNDLTEAAIAVTPVIAAVLKALAEAPGCALARLSGSGATCFGLYESAAAAAEAQARLRAAHPRWWVQAAPLAA